eukprot:Amastigsp_a677343_53.p4 type:complete len:139 gc:universal Amastigsp_a677343_53:1466-1050(-)
MRSTRTSPRSKTPPSAPRSTRPAPTSTSSSRSRSSWSRSRATTRCTTTIASHRWSLSWSISSPSAATKRTLTTRSSSSRSIVGRAAPRRPSRLPRPALPCSRSQICSISPSAPSPRPRRCRTPRSRRATAKSHSSRTP